MRWDSWRYGWSGVVEGAAEQRNEFSRGVRKRGCVVGSEERAQTARHGEQAQPGKNLSSMHPKGKKGKNLRKGKRAASGGVHSEFLDLSWIISSSHRIASHPVLSVLCSGQQRRSDPAATALLIQL